MTKPVHINTQTYDNAGDVQISAEDFKASVRRYKLDALLAVLGIVSSKIVTNDKEIQPFVPNTFNLWQLSHIALIAILYSNDYRAKLVDDLEMAKLATSFNQLEDNLLVDGANENHAYEFLTRLTHMQFPYQINRANALARSLILFSDIPSTLESPKIDVPKEIYKKYGVNQEDMLLIGTSLMLASKNTGFLDRRYLANATVPRIQELERTGSMQNVIDILSKTYMDFRDYYAANPLKGGLEQYGFNLLRTFPLVITSSNHTVIPNLWFLVEKVTNGIFYDLMDKFKTDRGNAFLEFFGKELFEKYIGMNLNLFVKSQNLLPEFSYGRNNELTSDWIITHDSTAVLMECKTSGLTIESKTSGDLKQIRTELKGRVVGALKQMIKLRNKIRTGEKGLERLNSIKDFHFVVVTYDSIYFANADFMRNMICEELQLEGYEIDFKFDVLSMTDIESLHYVGKKYGLYELLTIKHTKSEWIDMDMIPFLQNYLGDNWHKNIQNPLLSERHELYMRPFREGAKKSKKL